MAGINSNASSGVIKRYVDAQDDKLQTNIDSEASARASADTTLQSNINKEASARLEGDNSLRTDLTAETNERKSADGTLQSNIDTEASTRAEQVDSLRADLTAETNARETADSALRTDVDTVTAGLSTETSERKTADSVLQGNIDAETTARTTKDSELESSIASEVTRAKNAESTLTTNLNAEVTRAKNAEQANATAISNEASTRETNDNALSARIDVNTEDIAALKGRSIRYAVHLDSASPTQAQLTSAYQSASGSTAPPEDGTTLVDLNYNKEYTWFESSSTWVDRGSSTITPATNSSYGSVKGQTADGTVKADDGLLSVNGWSTVKNDISANAESISNEVSRATGAETTLQNNIDAEATARTSADTTLQANIDKKVTANTAITGGTFTKVTVDTKGLVTSGASLSASDIPTIAQSQVSGLTSALNGKQAVSNLVTAWQTTPDNTHYPSERLVSDSITSEATARSESDATLQANIDKKVTANANITAGTNCKITYDAKGLVTAGTSLSASDIPTIPESKVANLVNDLAGKQDTLTAGENITISGTTISAEDSKVSQAVSTADSSYPVLLKNGTGTGTITSTVIFDDAVTINPSTGELKATKFTGPLTGNVTGDCTGRSGSTWDTIYSDKFKMGEDIPAGALCALATNGKVYMLTNTTVTFKLPMIMGWCENAYAADSTYGQLALNKGGIPLSALVNQGFTVPTKFFGFNSLYLQGTLDGSYFKSDGRITQNPAYVDKTYIMFGKVDYYLNSDAGEYFTLRSYGVRAYTSSSGNTNNVTHIDGMKVALAKNAGSATRPVYIDSGLPVQCSKTLEVSVTGGAETAKTANVAIKLGTATVGSATQPIYLNAGTATATTSTVGGTSKPMYLNAGVMTAISDTVGDVAKPVYLNAGTITACSQTVGSSTGPVYMNAGTITACESLATSISPQPQAVSASVGSETTKYARGDHRHPAYLSRHTVTLSDTGTNLCQMIGISASDYVANGKGAHMKIECICTAGKGITGVYHTFTADIIWSGEKVDCWLLNTLPSVMMFSGVRNFRCLAPKSDSYGCSVDVNIYSKERIIDLRILESDCPYTVTTSPSINLYNSSYYNSVSFNIGDYDKYFYASKEFGGNATSATKLQIARNIQTDLASSTSASFNGSANVTPGVKGILPVAHGGTGNSSVDTAPTANSTKMVTSGGVASALDGKQDKLTAGANITISGNTISAEGTTYDVATTSANGLMSSTDKAKLDGIEAGAQKNTVTGVKGSSETAYRTGDVSISKANIGLENVDNTADSSKVVKGASEDGSGNVITDSYVASGEVSGQTVTLLSKSGNTLATFTTQATDTKNTAGSTDTSSKIFLIGATSQAANPQTYSHDTAYVGTDGKLYSGSKVVIASGDTATAASKLATAQTIDGATFDGSSSIIHYGYCTTAGATAAKVVSIPGFTLVNGAIAIVRFALTNTASNSTLNVNNTGAIKLYYGNGAIKANKLIADRVYMFVYDGTYYRLIGSVDTTDTAGATDISAKIFLIGATSQTANAKTYSHDTVYVASNGKLYSDGKVVITAGDVDSALSSTSTNPVQNKVVNDALDAKQDKVTISTSDPSGGKDGDIWFKYAA